MGELFMQEAGQVIRNEGSGLVAGFVFMRLLVRSWAMN